MRFTSRTKSILWRDDATLREAVACLADLLASGEHYIRTIQMGPGHGVLCNNVLHNRTAFDQESENSSRRLMFRIRFHNRVPEEI